MPQPTTSLLRAADVKCVVFDYAFTLSSDLYFSFAPAGCADWRGLLNRRVFHKGSPILDPWMSGQLALDDIAAMLAPEVNMDAPSLAALMREGCGKLMFNQAVWDFAVSCKERGPKTALVTANMDVFTEVVVPAHGLNKLFDVILNTADCRELRKEVLWPIAFKMLGDDIGYHNSLLIEDGEDSPGKFRERGGWAYQYNGDAEFAAWLNSVGLAEAPLEADNKQKRRFVAEPHYGDTT